MDEIFLLIKISDNSEFEQLEKIYNRITIAQLTYDEVDKIVKCCSEAVEYWKNKIIKEYGNNNKIEYLINYLSNFIKILARFQLRLSSEEAKNIIDWL